MWFPGGHDFLPDGNHPVEGLDAGLSPLATRSSSPLSFFESTGSSLFV
jgi:hypothetical protein